MLLTDTTDGLFDLVCILGTVVLPYGPVLLGLPKLLIRGRGDVKVAADDKAEIEVCTGVKDVKSEG